MLEAATPYGLADMVAVKIDGRLLEVPDGTRILAAARSAGIEIPVLCDDKRLKPSGSCRMCIVEVAGQPRPAASCMTEVRDGMVVETHTPHIEDARRMNLKMLARNYPPDSLRQPFEKPFHNLARDYGLDRSDFRGRHDRHRVDDSHPYIRVDMSRCIECYRCVRICDEVEGRSVWTVVGRGKDTRIVPDSGTKFADSSCASCGACVDTCPTGALEDKSVLASAPATAWTRTVCPYCGVGCEMNVGTCDDMLVQIKPAVDSPVNRGHLCVKGRYAFNFVDASDRVTEPMIRVAGDWKPVSWGAAIEYTAIRLREIVAQSGRESIGVLGSSRATNEENYLTQKFTRIVLGTNNVDCCARVCHTPSAAAMKMMLGTGAATNSFAEIELARTIMICGANPTENHPVVGERIKQAVLNNGTKLIVIDPRRTEIAEYADVHLALRPGTNVPLLNAIAYTIIEEGLADAAFLEGRVLEFDEFRVFVEQYSPEAVSDICGVSAALIRKAARIYATDTPSMCFHGLGTTEHVQGTEGVMCLINLALLTGNIGRRGTGINPLRGQNNVQGAAHMGCDPGILTGSISIDDGRPTFEQVWNAQIPGEKGLNLLQMLDAARDGKLKALWTIGYDVYLSNANERQTASALRSLELVIIQDLFMNETAREFGHVFLPAVSSFEKDGTFMNGERRVQRVRKAIEPRGDSRADWQIICDLARAMGYDEYFDYQSPEEIWDEIRAVWKGAAGITYRRMESAGLQWPCMDEDDPGTEILHADEFSNGKRTELRRIKFRPTKETVSEDFPFLLTTGRTLSQFNAGTMTARTPNIEIRPSDLLVLNPSDGDALEFCEGETARVESRWGSALLPVEFSDSVKPGEAFATFHSPEIFLNRITSPHRDRYVQSPEYKVTAIRISKSSEGVGQDEFRDR